LRSLTRPSANAPKLHLGCFACGSGADGLHLRFVSKGESAVSAEWFCRRKYQSYSGILHGGVIATILDAAMTNCLLFRGISGVTARMCLHYSEPVRTDAKLTVEASIARSRPPLHELRAEITQNGRLKATAEASFMEADFSAASVNV